MLNEDQLRELYTTKQKSATEIAGLLGCSPNKVNYWLTRYTIPKRTISDAIYARNHPDGDPFVVQPIDSLEKATLYGMGIGLYWGEGTKANKYSVRLGNSDPALLQVFIKFLTDLFGVKVSDMKFGLQIFSDLNTDEVLDYWIRELSVQKSQFFKVHITPSGSLGKYRVKSQHGVVTVYYHNKRLRDILVGALPK